MSFSAMMDRLNKTDVNQEILNKVQQNYPVDERFWSPTLDKKGEAKAVIRFLPAPNGETDDFAKYFTHYIKENGKRYIERCRTTLGEADPAQELASRLGKDNKEIYSKYGRKARFIANILVLNDIGNPENNGKVFLFEFGNMIMKKIEKAMKGSDDPIDPKNPITILHPINGANFKVIVTQKGGNNDYTDSEFMAPSALFEGDVKKIEAMWLQAYPLKPLIAPSTFKSYEELSSLLASVVSDAAVAAGTSKTAASTDKAAASDAPKAEAPKAGSSTSDANPDKLFDEIVNGSDSMTSDEAVDKMFAS